MFDVAIVGLGAWGKRLVDAVQGKSDSVRFTAAVTRSPAKVETFAAERGIALGSAYETVLADPSIDGVVICGPAHVHVAQATAAMEAGKHVLVIKPLAQRRAEAEAMYDLAARRGVFLGLSYDRCFLPAADELRRLVKAGTLGRIVHAEGAYCVSRYFNMTREDWKTDAAVVPPGALADHMLYMMIELLGPVAELYACGHHHATDLDAADTASVTMRFASGASGLLTAMGVTADFSRMHVFGTEGWAEIRGSSHLEVAPLKGERTVTDFPAFDTLRAQLERFAAAAKGETPFPVSPETAIASVAALEAMGRSDASGGPVSV